MLESQQLTLEPHLLWFLKGQAEDQHVSSYGFQIILQHIELEEWQTRQFCRSRVQNTSFLRRPHHHHGCGTQPGALYKLRQRSTPELQFPELFFYFPSYYEAGSPWVILELRPLTLCIPGWLYT